MTVVGTNNNGRHSKKKRSNNTIYSSITKDTTYMAYHQMLYDHLVHSTTGYRNSYMAYQQFSAWWEHLNDPQSRTFFSKQEMRQITYLYNWCHWYTIQKVKPFYTLIHWQKHYKRQLSQCTLNDRLQLCVNTHFIYHTALNTLILYKNWKNTTLIIFIKNNGIINIYAYFTDTMIQYINQSPLKVSLC